MAVAYLTSLRPLAPDAGGAGSLAGGTRKWFVRDGYFAVGGGRLVNAAHAFRPI